MRVYDSRGALELARARPVCRYVSIILEIVVEREVTGEEDGGSTQKFLRRTIIRTRIESLHSSLQSTMNYLIGWEGRNISIVLIIEGCGAAD